MGSFHLSLPHPSEYAKHQAVQRLLAGENPLSTQFVMNLYNMAQRLYKDLIDVAPAEIRSGTSDELVSALLGLLREPHP